MTRYLNLWVVVKNGCIIMTGKDEKGITLADLAGSLVEVRIIEPEMTEKKGQQYLIITGEYESNEVKFGVIGGKNIENVLKHGRKENGSLFVKVPEKILKPTDDGKVQWINFGY